MSQKRPPDSQDALKMPQDVHVEAYFCCKNQWFFNTFAKTRFHIKLISRCPTIPQHTPAKTDIDFQDAPKMPPGRP
eukprot:12261344-Karenia_brevis.AAC.1